MADITLMPMFSWLGWAFVPGWATSTLQSIYYKLTIPVGQVPPRPGTPLFAKHHRRIRVLVLTLYLLYTLTQSLYDIRLAGDFFTYLSVTPSSPEREIKSKFRRLAARYHPDKIQSTSPDQIVSEDNNFVFLKLAQDTLLNPTLRYAYTRFGPTIVTVAVPSSIKPSIRTYVYAGLQHNLIPTYLINIASLTVLNYFFLPKWGIYWRYYILTFIFAIELYFLTHTNPTFSSLLPSYLSWLPPLSERTYTFLRTRTRLQDLLPPHLLPYQILIILRKLSMSMNIFISQLAPPPNPAQMSTSADGKPQSMPTALLHQINTSLSHLNQAATKTDAESTALLDLILTPYKKNSVVVDINEDGHEASVGDSAIHERVRERLRERMKEGVFQGALMGNPDVRDAIGRAVARRRNTSARTSNTPAAAAATTTTAA